MTWSNFQKMSLYFNSYVKINFTQVVRTGINIACTDVYEIDYTVENDLLFGNYVRQYETNVKHIGYIILIDKK